MIFTMKEASEYTGTEKYIISPTWEEVAEIFFKNKQKVMTNEM
ncbi:MAG: hypothetical protein Q7R52_02565 [archaeon]|nr:hypothetical protein [archaeon]